jgi:hypothetical protein
MELAKTAGVVVLGSALAISAIIAFFLVKGIISERG